MKRIKIQVNDRTFYKEFLTVLKTRTPIDKLRPKELDVLAELMHRNSVLQEYPVDERYDILFSTRVRKEMREQLSLSEDSFNNNLSILRKYGLITKDNKLNKSLDSVIFNNNFSLEFLFTDECKGKDA